MTIFLSERNISKVRRQSSLTLAYDISNKEKNKLVIKYTIFFIIGIAFLVLFWMFLSSFGAVFPNTQIFIFKKTLISISFFLLYPFFISIIPNVFRMFSSNSQPKNKEYVFKVSKFLEIL